MDQESKVYHLRLEQVVTRRDKTEFCISRIRWRSKNIRQNPSRALCAGSPRYSILPVWLSFTYLACAYKSVFEVDSAILKRECTEHPIAVEPMAKFVLIKF